MLTSQESFTKACIICTIPESYTIGLKDRNLGIDHVTVQEIFGYLLATYWLIAVGDFEANRNMIVTPFKFVEPIELLSSKLECRQWYLADARDPYTLIQLRNMAVQQIIQGQRYSLNVCEYMHINKLLKTYENCKALFICAQVGRQQDGMGAPNQGFINNIE